MAHQNSEDEQEFISKIIYNINNLTPQGKKILSVLPSNNSLLCSAIESGADRKTHHDFKLLFPNGDLKTVEFKGSKFFKPINETKSPWHTGVQMHNGPGKMYSITKKYAKHCWNFMDKIISDLSIVTPKPSYEEWEKDAFKQGKPKTPFVCEIREKGYGGVYLSTLRKKINATFSVTIYDLSVLMDEVQAIGNQVFNQKDYWLQIHGNIDNPDTFHVKWTSKMNMPRIIEVGLNNSKNYSDINFIFTCEDGTILKSKMRWGYGQLITNIRMDLK